MFKLKFKKKFSKLSMNNNKKVNCDCRKQF